MNLPDIVIRLRMEGDKQVIATLSGVERATNSAAASAGTLQSAFGSTGARIVALNQGLSLARQGMRAFASAIESTLGPGREFEQAMARSTAIMGDLSESTTTAMQEVALALSQKFVHSAEDAAKAYYYLASAGLSAEASMEALPAVMEFAAAGAFNLATATDLLTQSQNALGRTVRDDPLRNMQEMVKISDLLTATNNLASGSVQEFAEALTNKGGAALRVMNRSLEEGLAVLAAYANQGVLGSDAGEKLNQVLRDLPTALGRAEKAWKRHGLEITDSNGNLKKMSDVIDIITNKFQNMSNVDLRKLTRELRLQDRSVSALLQLLGTGDFQRSIESELLNAAGTTSDVAAKQMKNLVDQTQLFKNTLESIKIEAFTENNERLAEAVQETTRILDDNRDLLKNFYSGLIDGAGDAIVLFNRLADSILDVADALGVTGEEAATNEQRLTDFAQLVGGAFSGAVAGGWAGGRIGSIAGPRGAAFGGAVGATVGGFTGAAPFFEDAARGVEEQLEILQTSMATFESEMAKTALPEFFKAVYESAGNADKLGAAWNTFSQKLNDTHDVVLQLGTEYAWYNDTVREASGNTETISEAWSAFHTKLWNTVRELTGLGPALDKTREAVARLKAAQNADRQDTPGMDLDDYTQHKLRADELPPFQLLRELGRGANTTSFDRDSLLELRNSIYNDSSLNDAQREQAMNRIDHYLSKSEEAALLAANTVNNARRVSDWEGYTGDPEAGQKSAARALDQLRNEALTISRSAEKPIEELERKIRKLDEAYAKGAITLQENEKWQLALAEAYNETTPEAKAAAKASDDLKRALEQEAERARDVTEAWRDRLDPVRALRREMEDLRAISKKYAEDDDPLTVPFSEADFKKIEKHMQDSLHEADELTRGLENAVRGVGDDITDAMIDGFGNGVDGARDIISSFGKEIAKIILRELVVLPLLEPVLGAVRNVKRGPAPQIDIAVPTPSSGASQTDSSVAAQQQQVAGLSNTVDSVVTEFAQIPGQMYSGLSSIFNSLRGELGSFLAILFGAGSGSDPGDAALRGFLGSFIPSVAGIALDAINTPSVSTSTIDLDNFSHVGSRGPAGPFLNGNQDISRFHDGGLVTKRGPREVPAMLEEGEFVLSRGLTSSLLAGAPRPAVQTEAPQVINITQNIQPTQVIRAFNPQEMQRAARLQAKETTRIVQAEIDSGRQLAKSVNRRR